MYPITTKIASAGTIILCGLTLSGCFTKEIDNKQTEVVEGFIYKLHDKDPYTGRVLNYPVEILGSYSSGSCSVEVEKGLPNGETRCVDTEGRLIGVVNLHAGKRQGYEKHYDPETGKLKSEATWSNGKLDGVRKTFNSVTEKLTSETHYASGAIKGTEKRWDESGENLIVSFDWDNGAATGFDNSGELRVSLLNGKKHGLQQTLSYHNNKQYVSSEKNYDNGVKQGSFKTFDHEGNILEHDHFEAGLLKSREASEYDNGVRISNVSYIQTGTDPNGWDTKLAKNGLEQAWDVNGQLIREAEWDKGRLIRATRTVWVNGKVESQYEGVGRDNYEASQSVHKNGVERIFDENGALLAHLEWDKGELISEFVRLPEPLRNEHPGKMGVPNESSVYGNYVEPKDDFYLDSKFDEYGNAKFKKLVDTPLAGKKLEVGSAS